MSKPICVLSEQEHSDWLRGIVPSCTDHRHVRVVDARQMAHHGDYSPYNAPVARFVGPHHIVLKAAWVWRMRPSGRWIGPALRTMQLVQGG